MDLKVKDNKENHISKRTSFSVGVNLSTDRQKGEKCKRKKKKKNSEGNWEVKGLSGKLFPFTQIMDRVLHTQANILTQSADF